MNNEYRIIPIKDFPGYFIDTDGVVRSNKVIGRPSNKSVQTEMRRLKGVIHHTGYLMVTLYKNRKRYMRLIHRLVLEAFIGECLEGMECRHLNGDRADGRLSNLKWGTPKENSADRILHGTDDRGEKSVRSVLTEREAIEIYRLKGNESCRYLANRFDVHVNTIYGIWQKRRWKHIHKSPSL